jgi:hypothetical protein
MADAFLAKVVSGSGKEWIVTPQIIEDDGTTHPDIDVSAQGGITPEVGDTVLVLTMRNNLNETPIPRYSKATESNGVIIGVLTTASGYTLTGDFNFIGDIAIEGSLSITGDLTVTGDIEAEGDVKAGFPVQISLLTHTHANNAPAPGPTGPPLP